MRVGNYTLSDLLGRGGTSEVYAAEDALGEPVAVKVLRPALVVDAAMMSAFIAEGVRTREIAHPNVVRVLDVGCDAQSGACYLVMERIDGESLAARLARVGRIDEPALRALAAEVADGMHAAHARGVVHRDLKPSNIMLRGNAPTIIDFGIAKSLGASSVVVTERRIGTLAYMAPEQLADGLITPAVDIWALGVILFEAATGRLPFDSFREGRLPQLVDTPPRASSLAPISPGLDDLIARCLERDPGKRPASMAQIASVLRGDTDERITEDVGARVIPAAPAATKKTRRWLPIAAASGALAIAGVVGAVAMNRSSASGPSAADAPSATLTPPPDAAVAAEPPREPLEAAAPEAPKADDTVQTTSSARTKSAQKPPAAKTKPKVRKPARKPATKPAQNPREKRTTSQGETLD